MKIKIAIAAGALLTAVSSPIIATADESEPPYPTEPYIGIDRYYGSAIGHPPGSLVGWDITYCDFTVESHREPGASISAIESEDGQCFFR